MLTSSRQPRRKLTAGVKAEAVAMVEAFEGPIAKVARELNIDESSLGNRVTTAHVLRASARRPRPTTSAVELRQAIIDRGIADCVTNARLTAA